MIGKKKQQEKQTNYTYSGGSFNFRRLPISGQFVYWGQKDEKRRRGWCRPSIGLSFYSGDRNLDLGFHIGLIFFTLYFTLEDIMPRRWQPQYLSTYGKKTMIASERRFDFYYMENAIWLNLWDNEDDHTAKQKWINQMHVFHFPWDYDWVRTSNLLANGEWFHETYQNRMSWKEKHELEKSRTYWKESHPYTYALRSGEIQNVTATITVDEMEWRWRWFKWLPWPRKVRKGIWIEFSEEVGEERGSWKGGTLGCGYNLLPGETPIECLRRMEKERRFER